MKTLFFDSDICLSRRFCPQCRDLGADGREFRVSLVSVGWRLPAQHFSCPFGKPWGWTPPPGSIPAGAAHPAAARHPAWLAGWRRPSRGLGDTIEKTLRLLGITGCLERAKLIKPHGGCGGCRGRQAWCNRMFPYSWSAWGRRGVALVALILGARTVFQHSHRTSGRGIVNARARKELEHGNANVA